MLQVYYFFHSLFHFFFHLFFYRGIILEEFSSVFLRSETEREMPNIVKHSGNFFLETCLEELTDLSERLPTM